MRYNYLKSNRGSTLAMTIVYIFIISILGMAILSLAVMNFRVRVFDKQQKVNFYLAESGTEETYAKILEVSKAAIDLGNKCIGDFTNDSFTEEYRNYFSTSDFLIYRQGFTAFIEGEKNKVIEDEDYTSIYINADLTVNETEVKKLFNAMFKSVYKKYVNTNLPLALDITKYNSITDENRFHIISQQNPFDDTSDFYKVKFQSAIYNQDKDISDLNKYKSKEVSIAFELKVPNYGDTYQAVVKQTNINESPLWSKALAADKAIIIKGEHANVTVNGDVYAYGVKPSDSDVAALKNPYNFAGINLDSQGSVGSKSTLKINGNVATNSYIMPTKNYANIKVSGNVFCNTLAIPSGVEMGAIEVNGSSNVYAADDIELNGTKSTISIDGNFYGFEDGEQGHDKSSSIVINSPDIDAEIGSLENPTGSMLKISGRVFLAGTVYIDTDSPYEGEKGYQTGESVAIRKGGNPSNPELNNYMVYAEDYALKDDEGNMAAEDRKFLGSDIEFINYPPLYLANKFLQLTDSGSKFFNAKTRSEYSYLFYKYRNDDSIVGSEIKLNLGGNSNLQIDESKILYSLGNVIANQSMVRQKLIEDPLYQAYRNDYINKYNFYVNKLASVSRHTQTDTYNSDKVSITDYVDLVDYNNLSETSQQYKELVYVHDSGKPLLIRGVGGNYPSELTGTAGIDYFVKDMELDSQLKGIVITNGDVYITGTVNYYGTIITTGHIYVIDSNPKVFNNTYTVQQYLWNKIFNTNIDTTRTIYSLFKNSRMYNDIIKEVKASSTAESINLQKKYEDLLSIVEWKRLK